MKILFAYLAGIASGIWFTLDALFWGVWYTLTSGKELAAEAEELELEEADLAAGGAK